MASKLIQLEDGTLIEVEVPGDQVVEEERLIVVRPPIREARVAIIGQVVEHGPCPPAEPERYARVAFGDGVVEDA